MNQLSKVWTASIAYVALAVGAGLSVMYNVLQTMAIRADALQVWDIVTAVAMPGIVVLMVELFVSRYWIGRPWHMQAVRWLACVAIGGVAMRASWTHGHAWMLGHGHTEDVAMAWPLAIDLLAILATALILAGRGHGQPGPPVGQKVAAVVNTMATGQYRAANGHTEETGPVATERDVAIAQAAVNGHTMPSDFMVSPVVELPEDMIADLDSIDSHVDRAWADAGQAVVREAETIVASVQAKPGLALSVPADVIFLLTAWSTSQDGPTGRDVDELLAAHTGKSVRTARRWRSIVTGKPVSGPPSS